MKPIRLPRWVWQRPGLQGVAFTGVSEQVGLRSDGPAAVAPAGLARATMALCFVILAARTAVAQPAASPPESKSDSPEAVLPQRAAAIAREGFSELSSNLLAAITRSGLNAALPYCAEKAMPLTRAVAQKHGVGLKRITHKPRNPDNQASATELALLRQFQADVAAKRTPAPALVTNANQTVSVYVPIVIPNALCLMCHGQPGTEISPDLQATLRKLYPNDQATGFGIGDLRGAWRVDFTNALPRPSATREN
ncbi:MAG: DUF3365 domain-containing protein [Verrucomicrobiae bacterium]|nr:DUF3365 domain-containing protein [Verrucomicrobiae bacterium]